MKDRYRRRLRFRGPYAIPGAILVALLIAMGWLYRDPLRHTFEDRPHLLPTVFVALVVLSLSTTLILWIDSELRTRQWLKWAERAVGIAALSAPGWLRRWVQSIPDPLEWALGPLLRTSLGRALAAEWVDAGLGDKASRYVLLLALVAAAGWLTGQRVAGPVVGLALFIALPMLPRSLISGQATAQRRRFGEQLPQALDSLAAGLSAGLSLQQAAQYSQGELPQPSAKVVARLWRRMMLGFPAEEALRSLLQDQQEESLALVIEGIALQRQFGGDLVKMLEEMAELLRERVELEREVRAVTAQGRLSGIVVAGLVPASAGMLLLFNPRYIDVLFNTLAGQALLVVALLLLFVGWWIISRLVRVRF